MIDFAWERRKRELRAYRRKQVLEANDRLVLKRSGNLIAVGDREGTIHPISIARHLRGGHLFGEEYERSLLERQRWLEQERRHQYDEDGERIRTLRRATLPDGARMLTVVEREDPVASMRSESDPSEWWELATKRHDLPVKQYYVRHIEGDELLIFWACHDPYNLAWYVGKRHRRWTQTGPRWHNDGWEQRAA